MDDDSVDSETRSGGRGRLIAALAVAAVPVLALAAFVLRGAGDEGRDEARLGDDTTTTAPADGAEGSPTTEAPGGEAEAGSGDQPPPGQEEAPLEVPSRPVDAGPEGDRTVATYPQPTVPPGGCTAAEVVDLGEAPSPGCVRVAGDRPLVFRNRTGGEISLVAEGLNEIVAPGGEYKVGRAADAFPSGRSTFWSPGNPALSGFVEVV